MMYIVKSKPNGDMICECKTEKDAFRMISIVESKDVQDDTFEPDTYYIEEGEE